MQPTTTLPSIKSLFPYPSSYPLPTALYNPLIHPSKTINNCLDVKNKLINAEQVMTQCIPPLQQLPKDQSCHYSCCRPANEDFRSSTNLFDKSSINNNNFQSSQQCYSVVRPAPIRPYDDKLFSMRHSIPHSNPPLFNNMTSPKYLFHGGFNVKPSTKEENRYQCPYCTKRFSRPSSLKIHINSHTGEKPFVCTEPGCGRRFSVHSNMRRHLRVHRIGRPIKKAYNDHENKGYSIWNPTPIAHGDYS
ncbi:14178_t:CDS:2 [Dentiscutata erythropus]|uniref:14178_t:CDS:1 n=1 Tax=Dentiscutata erythropus TaxID=1348616 RepID=A0A9N8ZAZ0_9GLOM|nr:14178_t:CDS:2 [Dentiscutata erythropus]